MAWVHKRLGSGSYDQLVAQAKQVNNQLEALPEGTRLEAVLVFRNLPHTQINAVGFVARLINSAAGLAAWIASRFGDMIQPWPGEPFAWADPATGTLRLRWVKEKPHWDQIVEFLTAGGLVALIASGSLAESTIGAILLAMGLGLMAVLLVTWSVDAVLEVVEKTAKAAGGSLLIPGILGFLWWNKYHKTPGHPTAPSPAPAPGAAKR